MIQTSHNKVIPQTAFNRARAVDQTPPAITETVKRMARFMLNRARANVPTSEADLLRQGFSGRQIRQYGIKATVLAQEQAAAEGVYKPDDSIDPETSEHSE